MEINSERSRIDEYGYAVYTKSDRKKGNLFLRNYLVLLFLFWENAEGVDQEATAHENAGLHKSKEKKKPIIDHEQSTNKQQPGNRVEYKSNPEDPAELRIKLFGVLVCHKQLKLFGNTPVFHSKHPVYCVWTANLDTIEHYVEI